MAIDTSVLNINFDVQGCSTNCQYLTVGDLSNWGPAVMNPTYIDITPPGSPNPISNLYQKNQLNSFNTNNLGLSDVTDYSYLGNIPDGIYTICVRVCMGQTTDTVPVPIYKTSCKYWLQDCQFRCMLDRKLLAIDLTCQPCKEEFLKIWQEIDLFLMCAHAQINQCNVNKASEFFQRAQTLLRRFTEPGQDEPCRNCNNNFGGFPN